MEKKIKVNKDKKGKLINKCPYSTKMNIKKSKSDIWNVKFVIGLYLISQAALPIIVQSLEPLIT